MTLEGVLWSVIVFLAVAAFIFAAAGLMQVVALIGTAAFLVGCTIALIWTVARVTEEER